jgi:hypothetical protein
MKRKAALICVTLLCFVGIVLPVYAQDLSNGTAIGIVVNEKNVKNGSLISSTTDGYKMTTSPYDPQLFGVVSLKPAIYLSDTNAKTETPVISTGTVLVRVSSANGTIAKGDFVTSSHTPGVAQKATDNGYILGTAEEGYSSNDPQKEGLILVTLHPHFAQITKNITHNVYNAFTLGLNAAVDSPLGVIRYAVAGTITLLSFFFGFRFFARASNRGVEAIGRNPLAKQAILMSVFINTIITVAIMFFGVAISYLILVL